MKKSVLASLLFILLIPGAAVFARPASAEVVDAQVEYQFGESITFQGLMQADVPVSEAFVSFQAEGGEVQLVQAEIDDNGNIQYTHDARALSVRPFARVYYWFQIELENGEEYTSPSYWFDYEDNRFEWETVEDGAFQVRFYQGDEIFGQKVLNVAHEGLQSIQKLLPLSFQAPLRIYVYASAADLQSALQIGGQSYIAGYAHPDLGVVMISVKPGPDQNLQLERQVPHELAHVLLYGHTGQNYDLLPIWLREGVASLAELYPDPDYERALQDAKERNTLLPMESLCDAFPADAAGNYLAYAQSASATRFFHNQYGNQALLELIQQYQSGKGCSEGLRDTTGQSLRQFETRWQQEVLQIQVGQLVFSNMLPYVVLFGVILIPAITSGLIIARRQARRSSTSTSS